MNIPSDAGNGGADPQNGAAVDPAVDPNKDLNADPNAGQGADPEAQAPADETPDQKEARLARMLDRHQKKHGLGKYANGQQPSDDKNKSGDLDYGQKAFLVANGVKDAEEVALVQTVMKDTGKTLEQVLESKYFQAELKEMRDAKATADATPNGTKRSGQSARDTVEYWLAKGELPPADQVKLRRDVVNARMKAESSGNPFTSNPVVR